MKIKIVTETDKWSCEHTGKGNFLRRLKRELGNKSHVVLDNVCDKADIALWVGKKTHERVKSEKIILRLGNPHFDTSKDYKALNKRKIKAIKQADGIIYQSEFTKKMCHKFLCKPDLPEKVIFNGSDLYKHQSLEIRPYVAINTFIASTRKWTDQKRLPGIIKAFRLANIPDSELIVFGDVRKKDFKAIKSIRGNEKFYRYANIGTLIDYFKICKALVSICYADACPNSVVEALSMVVPVICSETGGTKEIAPDFVVKDKCYKMPFNSKKVPGVDINDLAQKFRDSLGANTNTYCHVEICDTADRYVKFFEEVLNN